MNAKEIKKHITQSVEKVRKRNQSNTDKYKERLLGQIRVNLLEKKQSVKANQGLIDRYRGATPQPLTQMQEALLGATHG